jgi:hypothetical protein
LKKERAIWSWKCIKSKSVKINLVIFFRYLAEICENRPKNWTSPLNGGIGGRHIWWHCLKLADMVMKPIYNASQTYRNRYILCPKRVTVLELPYRATS